MDYVFEADPQDQCAEACNAAIGPPIERLDRCELKVDPDYVPGDTATAYRPGGTVSCSGELIPWCR